MRWGGFVGRSSRLRWMLSEEFGEITERMEILVACIVLTLRGPFDTTIYSLQLLQGHPSSMRM